MDLEKGIFKSGDPDKIAVSVKDSAASVLQSGVCESENLRANDSANGFD